MDTLKERDKPGSIFESGKPPWAVYEETKVTGVVADQALVGASSR